eukprot:CAMPEP_0198345228 /NCGR_PEP_ID=MMETSP1450-20131203/72827_1 /TAXON_ID=753684 ORGANISM="Madagascaria erythrocladiodes, Strain CCMP3234" /NCGR_SAMPLE_ID=MMETSP1450 /ASSEMBLY_ACC=CAM_ASM_001115 /LENGTH=47 /DNA_ID= /DNA_START= /DNA_END= /DNA_ORIENTATION=
MHGLEDHGSRRNALEFPLSVTVHRQLISLAIYDAGRPGGSAAAAVAP